MSSPQSRKKQSLGGAQGSGDNYGLETYASNRRRSRPARPISPVPSNDKVPGSGVVTLPIANPVLGPHLVPPPTQKWTPHSFANCATVSPCPEITKEIWLALVIPFGPPFRFLSTYAKEPNWLTFWLVTNCPKLNPV